MYRPRNAAVTNYHDSGAYASIVADSISPEGVRLTTIEARFHRFVLAEFNTHRVFSRNSASSRAIPLDKQMYRTATDPAWPVSYPAEKPGMQGGDELEGEDRRDARDLLQDIASQTHVKLMGYVESHPKERRLHKSVLNRMLEPVMWHTVVVTSTSWSNFLEQRCSPLAQPEIRAVAECMREVLEVSEPEKIEAGEWHLPYIDFDDFTEATRVYGTAYMKVLREVSVARCARVSYMTQDGHRSHQDDLILYQRLLTARPMHASPMEHVATPAAWNYETPAFWDPDTSGRQLSLGDVPRLGNLLRWLQWRHVVEGRQRLSSGA
jgi:thymidylate synthase ThyX